MIEHQISLGAALNLYYRIRNEFIVQRSFITEFGNKLIVQPDYCLFTRLILPNGALIFHPPEQRAPPANLTHSWEAYAIRGWRTPLVNSLVSPGA